MVEKSENRLNEKVFISLERALQRGRCCICRLVRETEEQHIWFLLYEHTGDPPIRRQFDETSGFCHYHGQLAAEIIHEREMMSESAMARLYETAVKTYRESLQALSVTKRWPIVSWRTDKSRRRYPTSGCMVCETSHHAVIGNIRALLRMLESEEHLNGYTRSDGLCNPHLALALQKVNGDIRPFLLKDQELRMEGLQKRLFELKRKHSYDVDEKPTHKEKDSWTEALWRFTGVEWEELLIKRQEPGNRRRMGST